MANEISQFYTCVSHTQNSNNNENLLIKNHSLPANLISGSFNSCISFQNNPRKENKINNTNSNISTNSNVSIKRQKECSELIKETQQKLQNLKLESFINTFPFDPYSNFAKEEKQKNKLFLNYTEVINNERKNNKRKLNSNSNSCVIENERIFKKQNSSGYEKISEVKKFKSTNSINNKLENSKISSCEINKNNIQNLKHGPNSNLCEINKNNSINNVNMKSKVNENVYMKLKKQEYTTDDSDSESDYKKLNNNINNIDCWGILQSINPKFQTIYLNESNFKNECIIGRNRNCNIW